MQFFWRFDKKQAGIYVKQKVTDPNFQENVKDGVKSGWESTKNGAKYVIFFEFWQN